MRTNRRTLVLDAMGVIYSVKDDVRDLLFPFIKQNGGCSDIEIVWEHYLLASLGKISSSQFWNAMHISPEFEDEYLQRHTLTDGLIDFLGDITLRGYKVWCLSNDVSEWSKKLMKRFRLDEFIIGFVISGDVGHRKPDQAIFHRFVQQSGKEPDESIFIDDSLKNLDSAKLLGFDTILFKPDNKLSTGKHKHAANFVEINALL